ncbi:MAG: bifunctional nuclease family protein [Planctomycetes bacterium]|nr:bifunctional nuclease family protein [Planctomycetota bacterium]
MELVQIEIERVIATTGNDFAVVLKAPDKRFLIFVGRPEIMALYRELQGMESQRPMPHDVVANLLRAFDIEVRGVVISSIVDNVFCATLLLRQDQPGGERQEVRLDLRASDAMIVALKMKLPLHCAAEVLAEVRDVSADLPAEDEGQAELGD